LVAAYYLNDEWQANEALRLDGGFRYEHNTLSGRRENHGRFNLGDAKTLADDEVIYGNGSFRPYDFSYNHLAFSAGGNYRVNPNLAFYARGSKGFRMPDFDQFRAVNENEDQTLEKGEVEKVLQFEGGVKLTSPRFALFGALFFAGLNHLPFDDEVADPATGQLKTERRFANSTTIGMELEATYSSAKGWGFDLIATLQNPRLRDFTFTIDGAMNNFAGSDLPLKIKKESRSVRRIPQVLADFKPFVKISGARLFGNLRYVGARFVDDANEVTLPAYTELHAGASYTFPRVTLSLNAANLFNTIGLTEGNPRIGQVVGVKQDIYLARPILGRTFTFAAAYSF
jgi:outer membrane receptor protein involved in Fe transport